MFRRHLSYLLFLVVIVIVRSENSPASSIVPEDSDSTETASIVEKQKEELKDDLKTTLVHMNQPKSIRSKRQFGWYNSFVNGPFFGTSFYNYNPYTMSAMSGVYNNFGSATAFSGYSPFGTPIIWNSFVGK